MKQKRYKEKRPQIGDLVQDKNDGEIGLVMSVGPGIQISYEDKDYPNGSIPSWKLRWPSIPHVCDLGYDTLTEGHVEIISKA